MAHSKALLPLKNHLSKEEKERIRQLFFIFISACKLEEAIDANNINSLWNCTVIEGHIQILRHTFQEHIKFRSING